MFKRKVSICMESGNKIYLRMIKTLAETISENIYDYKKSNKNNISSIGNLKNGYVPVSKIEAIIIKKWWQRWG